MLRGQEGRQETCEGCCQPPGNAQRGDWVGDSGVGVVGGQLGESRGIGEAHLSKMLVCWPQGRGKAGQGVEVGA